jgi:hypothetical protein
MKSYLSKVVAKKIAKRLYRESENAKQVQEKLMQKLIRDARNTQFGRDHNFKKIKNHNDFIKHVPVRDYEALKPYVERVVAGESDVIWKGKPLYFAKTSGTTSGAKFIPLTKESMPTHINAARNALLMYIADTGNTGFVKGKMIFLQGSPEMNTTNGIKTGRLSGIAAHYVPSYLTKNRLPSWDTNCIEDWETKVEAIVDETIEQNMTLISGIPSWVQMYFEKLMSRSGKKIGELFPNFDLFVYGGVNYEPYRNKFENLIGKKVDSVELYPASEGFIAFQDKQHEKGMLLLVNNGMFFEFIPAVEFFDEKPSRYTISEVKLGINYVIILSTNAGLWAYNIGDTVEFVSLNPPRIIVTGRIKHFISAFGEHVIGKEVERALQSQIENAGIRVNEFTVAPQINPERGLPYHEWFIEFDKQPSDLNALATGIDQALCRQNAYYRDLISGKVLRPLIIRPLQKNAFNSYMKSVGKLGGQNKIPRLSNDRKIADNLKSLIIK